MKRTTLKKKARLSTKSTFRTTKRANVPRRKTHKKSTKRSGNAQRITRKNQNVGGAWWSRPTQQEQQEQKRRNYNRIMQNRQQYNERMQAENARKQQMHEKNLASRATQVLNRQHNQPQRLDQNAVQQLRKEDAQIEEKRRLKEETDRRDQEFLSKQAEEIRKRREEGEENVRNATTKIEPQRQNYSNVDDVAAEFNTFQDNFLRSDTERLNKQQHDLEINQLNGIINTRLRNLEGDESADAQKARARLEVMKKGVSAYNDDNLLDDIKNCSQNDQACKTKVTDGNEKFIEFGNALDGYKEEYKSKVEPDKNDEIISYDELSKNYPNNFDVEKDTTDPQKEQELEYQARVKFQSGLSDMDPRKNQPIDMTQKNFDYSEYNPGTTADENPNLRATQIDVSNENPQIDAVNVSAVPDGTNVDAQPVIVDTNNRQKTPIAKAVTYGGGKNKRSKSKTKKRITKGKRASRRQTRKGGYGFEQRNDSAPYNWWVPSEYEVQRAETEGTETKVNEYGPRIGERLNITSYGLSESKAQDNALVNDQVQVLADHQNAYKQPHSEQRYDDIIRARMQANQNTRTRQLRNKSRGYYGGKKTRKHAKTRRA